MHEISACASKAVAKAQDYKANHLKSLGQPCGGIIAFGVALHNSNLHLMAQGSAQ